MSGHVDQTMTEISASGGAYRDYLRVTRPAVARQMRAFGLEFEFCAAERDKLLRGIELAPVQRVSKCLESRLGEARLGYIVSGHLLHRYGIRVLPTLSAPMGSSTCSPLIRCATAVSHRQPDVRHSR